MRKKFESRHFSGPNIDYIDEILIPEPKRQNDDKAAKEEASNQQRKALFYSISSKSLFLRAEKCASSGDINVKYILEQLSWVKRTSNIDSDFHQERK